MTIQKLKETLQAKPSYFKKGKGWLSEKFDVTLDQVEKAISELKGVKTEYTGSRNKKQVMTYLDKIKERNPGLKIAKEEVKPKSSKITPYTKGDPNNVLFIGDLHAPFILDGYLEFNLELQKKYNCGTIIFAGDIIEGGSWSYHEKNVDGLSVKDELTAAIEQLQDWYKAFPNAKVLYGNHDLLISRKAKTFGLSQLFLKHLGDIIDAPKTWEFMHEYYKDNVLYIHGSVGNAFSRATTIRHSVCQGHLHSESFVQWSVSEIDAIFGLQVGCGINRDAYAFEYGKPFPKKPVISSGVILEKGTLPIVELMKL